MITKKPPKEDGDVQILEYEVDEIDLEQELQFELTKPKTKVVIRLRRRRLVFSA